jgi:translation initiation factor 2B subunit (eIF-2B alpha/beta/delta family)
MRLYPGFCKRISEQLISAQPSMGIMLNLAYGIGKMAGIAQRNDLLLYLDGFETAIESHSRLIAVKVSGLLKKVNVVMTYSSSSTVLESFKYAYRHGSRFRVVVLESRPMNEGRDMMLHLVKASIPVTYVTDAAGMSLLVSEDIDAVLIGGDAMYRNGFVCKTGSRAIAELCKKRKVRFYGLCGTEKIIPEELSDKFVITNNPAKELTAFKHKFATITNRYFEAVPYELFTKIVTDSRQSNGLFGKIGR